MDIAVLIPCFNEELTIGQVVRDFINELDCNVFVFDNNSTDDTFLEAQKAGAHVVFSEEQGKGNVVQHMFKTIDADVYLMVDGDGTYPAKYAKEMINLIKNKKADMVIGDRLSTNYYNNQEKLFHGFGNRLVKFLINNLFGGDICDVMTGYRAFSKEFVKSSDFKSEGFEIETEMTIFALRNNFKIASVPVQYGKRPEGSFSKLNTVIDGIKVVWLILSQKFLK